MNGDKTDEIKLATGLCCNADVKSAYMEMCATYETFSGERFYKKSESSGGKEKIRLHHYIQSFKPDEITPEEAHKIGVEWARKVFGENHQVLVTTHVDKNHIHNHFAVSAYNLDGKKWYGNKTTLKRCRDISDKICKAHGKSVIEKPQYNSNQRYSEWLARQTKSSWKQNLCDDIDKLILLDNVNSVEDLAERLRGKGYIVSMGKHLSVKTAKDRKAIRTYRLGDGYAIEELRYRIENKNQEMSLSAIAMYQGIQREYALCLRELQIMLYHKPKDSYNVTYSELRRDSELLTYLCDNNIDYIGEVSETNEEDDPYFYYNHERRMISETMKENLESIVSRIF